MHNLIDRLGYLKGNACWGFEAAIKTLVALVTGFRDVHIGIERRLNLARVSLYLFHRFVPPDSNVAMLMRQMSSVYDRLLYISEGSHHHSLVSGGYAKIKKRQTWTELPGDDGFLTMDGSSIDIPLALGELLNIDQAAAPLAWQYSRFITPDGTGVYDSALSTRAARFTHALVLARTVNGVYMEEVGVVRQFITIDGAGTYAEAVLLTPSTNPTMMLSKVVQFAEDYFSGDLSLLEQIKEELREQFCTYDPLYDLSAAPAIYYPVANIR